MQKNEQYLIRRIKRCGKSKIWGCDSQIMSPCRSSEIHLVILAYTRHEIRLRDECIMLPCLAEHGGNSRCSTATKTTTTNTVQRTTTRLGLRSPALVITLHCSPVWSIRSGQWVGRMENVDGRCWLAMLESCSSWRHITHLLTSNTEHNVTQQQVNTTQIRNRVTCIIGCMSQHTHPAVTACFPRRTIFHRVQ